MFCPPPSVDPMEGGRQNLFFSMNIIPLSGGQTLKAEGKLFGCSPRIPGS